MLNLYTFTASSFPPLGVLFSAHGVVSAIAQLVGALLFNSVYQATLSLFPGLVFLLCALLVLIPLLLLR